MPHTPWCTSRRVDSVVAVAATVVVLTAIAAATTVQQTPQETTVQGCVERDAASSMPIFKLVTSPPVKIYRLDPPKGLDLALHVGHMVTVTGTVTEPQGGRIPELVSKTLTGVHDTCPTGTGSFYSIVRKLSDPRSQAETVAGKTMWV